MQYFIANNYKIYNKILYLYSYNANIDLPKRKECKTMKTSTEIFAENLRDLLISKNKTQADLKRDLKVTDATVSRWANGIAMPRSAMLDRICLYLHCTPEDLLTDRNKVVEIAPEDVIAEEIHNNSRLFRLMFYASKLSDEQLDKIIAIVGDMR